MANAIIRHAVKDNAWFTANASLVLQLGRIVFKSNTLTFVRGDGVTVLSALPVYDCSGGGVIQSVVAGVNVSVDNTDPLNPVVNSLSDRYKTTSNTSNTITPTGTKTFTVDAGLSYTVNQDVIVSFDANNYMNGHVVSYSGTTLVVDIQHKTGSGTYSSWVINLDGLPVTNTIAWGTITGTLSNQTDLNTALTNLQSNINTVDSDLSSHLNNLSNPHSTTLAQVVSANDFLPADITGGNDFVLRPDSTTPGAASAVIEKGDSWMYINAGQVWIGDKVQNIGYYANIGAGDTGIYNASGGVTVEASGSINMGGGVVTNVADAVGATDAVNKLQLDTKQDTFTSQTANTVFSAPNGSSGTPSFRLLTNADLPSINIGKLTAASSFVAFTDCHSAGDLNFSSQVNGSGTAVTARATPFTIQPAVGVVGFTMGTVATNRVALAAPSVAVETLFFGQGAAYAAFKLAPVTVSDGTNTYTARAGFIDSITGESTDGAFFRYNHTLNGGRWQCVTRSNAVETATDSGITYTVGVWNKFEISVNASGTSVAFIVNGTTVQTHTTNIPTGSGRGTAYGIMTLRTVGTASIVSLEADYMIVTQQFTGTR